MTAPVVDVAAWVVASRSEQHLAPTVTDAATLDRIAALLDPAFGTQVPNGDRGSA